MKPMFTLPVAFGFSLLFAAPTASATSNPKSSLAATAEVLPAAYAPVLSKEKVTATLSRDMLFVLDSSKPVADTYLASTSALSFADAAEASAFFNRFRDNLISFEVDYANKQVLIRLYRQLAPADWSVADWNTYLKKKSAKYSATK